jgi:hypothetical protein
MNNKLSGLPYCSRFFTFKNPRVLVVYKILLFVTKEWKIRKIREGMYAYVKYCILSLLIVGIDK